MLLKRLEKDNKIKAMYASSTICATIFDTTTKDLTVIFNNGGQYKYPSVSFTDYTRLEISESTGTDFNTYIKKKYTNFEKLDKISDTALNTILKEVQDMSAADVKLQLETKTKAMLRDMALLLADYTSTGKIGYDAFRKLETKINEYNKVANPQPTSAPTPQVVS